MDKKRRRVADVNLESSDDEDWEPVEKRRRSSEPESGDESENFLGRFICVLSVTKTFSEKFKREYT